MMHSAEKKVTGNSIYTHSILYYFGRQEHRQVRYCKQLFTFVHNVLSSLCFTSSVPSLLPPSCYIHNSKNCALGNPL